MVVKSYTSKSSFQGMHGPHDSEAWEYWATRAKRFKWLNPAHAGMV
ncbi:MAG: hypothetical protein ACTSUE_06290 [Promethearchaeota archaeon]